MMKVSQEKVQSVILRYNLLPFHDGRYEIENKIKPSPSESRESAHRGNITGIPFGILVFQAFLP